jgi:hypothetical protein
MSGCRQRPGHPAYRSGDPTDLGRVPLGQEKNTQYEAISADRVRPSSRCGTPNDVWDGFCYRLNTTGIDSHPCTNSVFSRRSWSAFTS